MNSQEYWKKREEENLRKNLKSEAEYIKEIEEIYDYMLDQIQREINGFYAKYAKKEGITLAEAKKRASKLDIEEYARKAKRYVKEKNFSKEANEEMRLYNLTMKVNRLELLKAKIGLELVSGFDELQKFFDEKLTDRTLEEFERQAGILGETVKNNQEAAHAIVNASFHNATFSDRIWMYQDMMKTELAQLLKTGLIQGKNPRALARHLSKRFGVSKYNAERLMRTELARVQMEAQKQSFERNGFEQYEFISLSTACPVCKALDGKHFEVKKIRYGENAPPMHPNCRCSIAAWEDGEEYEEWLDFLNKGGTTEEWKRNRDGAKGKIVPTATRRRKKSNTGIEQITKKAENQISKEERIKNELLSRKYEQLSLEEFKKMHHTVSREERKILYGKSHFSGYINSGNARKLNKLLREGSDLPKDYQEISNTLSEVIKKNSVQKDIVVTRYVSRDALESIAGISFPKSPGLLSGKEGVERYWTDIENLKENIKVGHSYIEKGFLSTSGVSDKNVMNDKEIKLVIKVPKGANAYITTNDRESEIIFGIGTKLEIANVSVENNRTTDLKIVLDCLMR